MSDHNELKKAKKLRRRSGSPEEEESVDSHIDRHEQQGWGIGPATTTATIALLFPSPWKNEDFCCFVLFLGMSVSLSPTQPYWPQPYSLFQAVQPCHSEEESKGEGEGEGGG